MTPDADARSDRLDSWKEIAAYLGRGVRTVQRWETTEGLPVHRLGQDRTGPVFAYRQELDAWWRQQSSRLAPEPAVAEKEKPPPASRNRWILVALGAGVIGFLTAALLLRVPQPAPARKLLPLTTEFGWELDPSLSPDGRQVAYVSIPANPGPSRIHVKTVGSDSSVLLTRSKDSERYPAWSPDGRMIAFLRREPQRTGSRVILIPAGGGAETSIAELNSSTSLAWSADGAWLLTKEFTNKREAVVAISVSTGRKHALTEPTEFGFNGLGLTPDSRRLIVARGGPGPSAILEIPLDRNLQPIGAPRTIIASIHSHGVVLTPDGRDIVYVEGTDEEGMGLWRRGLAPNAKPELIHQGMGRLRTLTMSRDGRRIAVASDQGFRLETWKMSLDRRPPEAVRLLASTHSDQNPDFSPDGKRIAFHSTRSGASDIWVADADGNNARRLTFTNARTTATPRWSPDGGWLAFESNTSGQSEVYVMRSNGGPPHQLTDDPALDAIPSWSRDGRSIYFCSDRTGRFEVWKTPAFGGRPEQVTRQGGFVSVESRDGRYLYYSQTRNRGPIYRMTLPAGEPELVAPDMHGLFFAVANTGVYFLNRNRIWFWSAETRQTREVLAPGRPLGFGLALSPDDRVLLFTQSESRQTDLYWMDWR
jgi:Tol biopolymer transport system component